MAATPGLTFERLLDWIEGRLSPEEASAVAALVDQADSSIQEEVARQRAFQALSAKTVLAAPPPEVRAVLMDRFATFAADRRAPSIFQRIVAALTFDSALQPGMAGARAAVTDSPRQLVYSTDVADIVINIQWRDQDQQANLLGQVLPNETELAAEEFAIQLLQGEREMGIVMADEAGEFAFEAIAAGGYQIVLSTQNTTIELPAVDLRHPTR